MAQDPNLLLGTATTSEQQGVQGIDTKLLPAGSINPRHLAATKEQALGDLYYSDGTKFVRLPKGATEQVLTQQNDGTLAWVTPTVTPTGVLVKDRTTTQIQVANTTTETDIYNYSVPAMTLGTAGYLRLSMYGTVLNNSGGAVNTTIKIKYGATTIATQLVTIPGDGTNLYGFKIDAFLVGNAATNAQKGGFVVTGRSVSNALNSAASGTAAEDSTTIKTLSMTCTFGTASSSMVLSRESAILELL